MNSKGALYLAGGLAIAAGITVIVATRNTLLSSDLETTIEDYPEGEEALNIVTDSMVG